MKYIGRVGSEHIEIDLESSSLPDIRATVDGRPYRLEVREVEPDVFWVLRDGASMELQVSMVGQTYEVRQEAGRLNVELLDRRAILAGSRAAGGPRTSEIRAPMPGRIVGILVEEGAPVEEGQGLLVVEAMKMQNEIRSTGTGRVEQILVKEGETVDAGQLLMVVGERVSE